MLIVEDSRAPKPVPGQPSSPGSGASDAPNARAGEVSVCPSHASSFVSATLLNPRRVAHVDDRIVQPLREPPGMTSAPPPGRGHAQGARRKREGGRARTRRAGWTAAEFSARALRARRRARTAGGGIAERKRKRGRRQAAPQNLRVAGASRRAGRVRPWADSPAHGVSRAAGMRVLRERAARTPDAGIARLGSARLGSARLGS